jgi:hypothetical protein
MSETESRKINYEDLTVDERLVSDILEMKEEYQKSEYRENYLKEVKKARKKYRQDREAKTFPWVDSSNRQIPLTAIAVDYLEPRLAGMLYNEDKFIKAKPQGEEDIPRVGGVEENIHWVLKNGSDWWNFVQKSIHDLLIDGTVFTLPVHEESKKIRRERTWITPEYVVEFLKNMQVPDDVLEGMVSDPEFPANVPQEFLELIPDYEEKEERVYKIPALVLDLNHCLMPDKCKDFSKEPFLRLLDIEYGKLKEKTKEKGGSYFNIDDKLVESAEDESTSSELDQTINEEQLKIRGSRLKKIVRCVEAYLPDYDLKDGKGKDWVIATVAIGSGTLIRKQRLVEVYFSNEKPIRRIPLFAESDAPFGHGVRFIIRHLEDGCTDLFNQMIDSGTIQIAPWFFYEASSGYDEDDAYIAPGHGVPVADATKIHFPNLTVSAQVYLQFINFVLAMFERLLSISDFGLGRQSDLTGGGGETLGGIQLITQQGQVQHSYRGKKIQNCYADIIKDIYLLYVQTVPLDLKKRLWKDQKWSFEQSNINSLIGNYDFEIVLNPEEANSLFNQQKEMTFIKSGEIFKDLANPVKVFEDFLKAFNKRPMEDYMDEEIREAIAGVLQAREDKMKQQEMMEKETNSGKRREIHTQMDMQNPQRIAEIGKQVIESHVKKGMIDAIEGELQQR